jgi:hypothetical protein
VHSACAQRACVRSQDLSHCAAAHTKGHTLSGCVPLGVSLLAESATIHSNSNAARICLAASYMASEAQLCVRWLQEPTFSRIRFTAAPDILSALTAGHQGPPAVQPPARCRFRFSGVIWVDPHSS